MREHAAELRSAGVDFVDLGDVFSGHEEPIYRDICCHVNDEGNELLARAIAEHVGAALERRGRPAD